MKKRSKQRELINAVKYDIGYLRFVIASYKRSVPKVSLNKAFVESCKFNNVLITKYLVDLGADISVDNDVALRNACRYGHLEIVKYLVENGANIHSIYYNEALINSCRHGYLNLVKYLIENGADIHVEDNYALFVASYHGHLEVVKYLVENGADVHAKDNLALRYAETKEVREYLESFIK